MSRASRKARLVRKAAQSPGVPTTRYTIMIVALAAIMVFLLGDRFETEARLSVPAGTPARVDACLDTSGTLRITAPGRRACPAGDRLVSWLQGTPASVPATGAQRNGAPAPHLERG
jgi:hypothetical protein